MGMRKVDLPRLLSALPRPPLLSASWNTRLDGGVGGGCKEKKDGAESGCTVHIFSISTAAAPSHEKEEVFWRCYWIDLPPWTRYANLQI